MAIRLRGGWAEGFRLAGALLCGALASDARAAPSAGVIWPEGPEPTVFETASWWAGGRPVGSGDVTFRQPLFVNSASEFLYANHRALAFDELCGVQSILRLENRIEPEKKTALATAHTFGGVIQLRGGVLSLGAETHVDTSVPPALPTAGLILRLDASETPSLTLVPGTALLSQWRDLSGKGNHASAESGRQPTLRENELGGLPVIDFSRHDGGPGGASLDLARALAGAKTILWVIGSSGGGGQLMTGGGNDAVFARGAVYRTPDAANPAGTNPSDPLVDGLCPASSASFRRNGRAIDATREGLSGGYDIVVATSDTAFGDLSGLGGRGGANDGGRQQLAEVVAYDRTLTEAEVKASEAHLYAKWLNGRGEVRHLSLKENAVVETPNAAREVVVERLTGARILSKKGVGTLRLADPSGFPGSVRLHEGTLAVGNPQAPVSPVSASAAVPTAGLVAHLDANDASSFAFKAGSTVEVDSWNDAVRGVSFAFRNPDGIEPPEKYRRPTVRKDASGVRSYLDFGTHGGGAGDGTSFLLLQGAHYLTAGTVVVVADSRQGGGCPLGLLLAPQPTDPGTAWTPFSRSAGVSWSSGHRNYAYDAFTGNEITATGKYGWDAAIQGHGKRFFCWVDGVRRLASAEPYAARPQVFTYQPAADSAVDQMKRPIYLNALGHDTAAALDAYKAGGMAFGEILVYDRILGETERVALEAHLRKKWLGGERNALEEIEVRGDVAVRCDRDVTVRMVSGRGTLRKTGAGRLTVQSTALDAQVAFRMEEGVISFSRRGEAAPALPPSEGLRMHFDASDAASLVRSASGAVTNWKSRLDGGAPLTAESVAKGPTVVTSSPLGKAALSFDSRTSGKRLLLPETALLRTLFFVCSPLNGGGQLWADSTSAKTLQATWRGPAEANGYCGSYAQQVFSSYYAPNALELADVRVGGRRISPNVDGFWRDGDYPGSAAPYTVVTVRVPAGATVNCFGPSGGNTSGGEIYGEILGYEQALSDRDVQAVEAHLAAKWFGAPLHGYGVESDDIAPGELSGVMACDVASGDTLRVGWLTGSGVLTKTGPGQMDVVGSLSGFDGTLDVREGTVRLAARKPQEAGDTPPVVRGLVHRFDPTRAETIARDAETGRLETWTDTLNGLVLTNIAHGQGAMLDDSPTGRATIDTGPFRSGSGSVQLARRENGKFLPIPFTSLFMVFAHRDEDRGCYPFCDPPSIVYLRRPLSYYGAPSEPLFPPADASGDRDVDLSPWVNGAAIVGTNGNVLASGYQVLSLATKPLAAGGHVGRPTRDAHLHGFAGRWPSEAGQTSGGMRLGEILVYDNADLQLTDAERGEVDAWLQARHLGKGIARGRYMAADGARAGEVRVATGATLDLNGFTQTVASVTGGGVVTGGALSGVSRIRWTPGETLKVEALALAESGVLEIASAESLSVGRHAVIASDTPIVRPQDLRRWTVRERLYPALSLSVKLRLSSDGKSLLAAVRGTGLLIVVQ